MGENWLERINQETARAAELEGYEKEVADKIRGIITRILELPEGSDIYADLIVPFHGWLEKKYTHDVADKYRLWHLMVFSSPAVNADQFDFPGDDSIERFFSKLADTYLNGEKERAAA